ncbi:MAG TPA: trypsin-like peptidase domain-containing protein [Nitrososphaerales archaeon]|nr:trypsin-like peptidase domain-containing protein [Nitrososphaerales archaeon]
MIAPNTVSSQVLFSTARIVAKRNDGKSSTGTAFFFQFKFDETRTIPVLITNKHVISETKEGTFLLHLAEKDSTGKIIPSDESGSITLGEFEKSWIQHPGGLDLCAMPIAQLLEAANKAGKDIFYITFGEEILPTAQVLDELSAVEDITMVGYPIGLWDSVNNLPLFRRGITASHPAVDFEREPVGLLDIATFPGSSGSPVMLLNEGSFATKGGLTVGNRLYLLGILYQYYYLKDDGIPAASDIPSTDVTRAPVQPAVHIGRYLKARELLELKKEFIKLASPPTPIK